MARYEPPPWAVPPPAGPNPYIGDRNLNLDDKYARDRLGPGSFQGVPGRPGVTRYTPDGSTSDPLKGGLYQFLNSDNEWVRGVYANAPMGGAAGGMSEAERAAFLADKNNLRRYNPLVAQRMAKAQGLWQTGGQAPTGTDQLSNAYERLKGGGGAAPASAPAPGAAAASATAPGGGSWAGLENIPDPSGGGWGTGRKMARQFQTGPRGLPGGGGLTMGPGGAGQQAASAARGFGAAPTSAAVPASAAATSSAEMGPFGPAVGGGAPPMGGPGQIYDGGGFMGGLPTDPYSREFLTNPQTMEQALGAFRWRLGFRPDQGTALGGTFGRGGIDEAALSRFSPADQAMVRQQIGQIMGMGLPHQGDQAMRLALQNNPGFVRGNPLMEQAIARLGGGGGGAPPPGGGPQFPPPGGGGGGGGGPVFPPFLQAMLAGGGGSPFSGGGMGNPFAQAMGMGSPFSPSSQWLTPFPSGPFATGVDLQRMAAAGGGMGGGMPQSQFAGDPRQQWADRREQLTNKIQKAKQAGNTDRVKELRQRRAEAQKRYRPGGPKWDGYTGGGGEQSQVLSADMPGMGDPEANAMKGSMGRPSPFNLESSRIAESMFGNYYIDSAPQFAMPQFSPMGFGGFGGPPAFPFSPFMY